MASEIKPGDKFVIEIEEVEWHPIKGHRYYVKGFDSLMLTDYGIAKLEKYKEPPKEVPHTCTYCMYRYCGDEEYPCVVCDKNHVEPRDMFRTVD